MLHAHRFVRRERWSLRVAPFEGLSPELSSLLVYGKRWIPPREARTQFSALRPRSDLQQCVCTSHWPAHLLFFRCVLDCKLFDS